MKFIPKMWQQVLQVRYSLLIGMTITVKFVTATSIETEAAQRCVGPLLVDCGKNPQLLLDDVR